MADWSDLVGLTVPQAEQKAAKYQHTVFVIKQGDMWADPHTDRDESRVNVVINTDLEPKVTAVFYRG